MSNAYLIAALVIAGVALGFAFVQWLRARRLRRDEFIRTYTFPRGLFERLAKHRPELGLKENQLVALGLRQFFLCYLHSGRRYVSMPSQVADDLWHEFILYTRNYETFCQRAFGRFLHHTPAVVIGTDRQGNEGLRRTWWFACKEDGINPKQPTRLPLLFALDTKLGIADGFRYAPDCEALRRNGDRTVHCGGDVHNSCGGGGSGCGGGDFGSSSDSSSCGGGGGCGGGGD
jgi:hypothetical protein